MTRAWIRTASGADIDLERPTGITIEDIAASLAKLPRFNGHTRVPYSVAQHSVWVARSLQRDSKRSAATALAGLLHDAPEALLGDMITPVQWLIFGGEDARASLPTPWDEANMMLLIGIGMEFNLPSWTDADWEAVHHFDKSALRTEFRDLMAGPEPDYFMDYPEPEPEPIRPFENWQTAQEVFLSVYHDLVKAAATEALR